MADLEALLGEASKKSEAEAAAAEMRMSLVKLESELAALAGARYEAERRTTSYWDTGRRYDASPQHQPRTLADASETR